MPSAVTRYDDGSGVAGAETAGAGALDADASPTLAFVSAGVAAASGAVGTETGAGGGTYWGVNTGHAVGGAL
jgi:hypothetical protein